MHYRKPTAHLPTTARSRPHVLHSALAGGNVMLALHLLRTIQ